MTELQLSHYRLAVLCTNQQPLLAWDGIGCCCLLASAPPKKTSALDCQVHSYAIMTVGCSSCMMQAW